MLPVLKRPLGSRNAIFSSVPTWNSFKTSVRPPDLVLVVPLISAAGFDTAPNAAAAAAAFFERTRSAHDLGMALGGREEVSDMLFSSCVFSVAASSVLAALSGTRGEAGSAGFDDVADLGRAPEKLGTAGIIGTAVRVSFRACAWLDTDCGTEPVRSDVLGTELREVSFSDGACEVAGVSCREGAATVDASDGSCSGSWSSSTFGSSAASLVGRATASFASCRFCLLRRRLGALGGNEA